MATPVTRLVTLEDVLSMDGDERFEVIDGEIVPMAPTGFDHGDFALQIATDINMYVRARRVGRVAIGDVGVVLQRNPLILRCPDVAYVSEERLPPVGQRSGFLEIAPDLSVEVVSPSDRLTEDNRKVATFLTHGTRQVWVVDPELLTVTIHDQRDPSAPRIYRSGDVLDGGDVLPGFTLAVDAIFT